MSAIEHLELVGRWNFPHLRDRALNLFRSGADTVDIATDMRVTEAQAVLLLEAARAAQRRELAAERMGRVYRD